MQQFNSGKTPATQIGLVSMGCISEDGNPACPRFAKCRTSNAMTCMGEAMQNFPEAKAEILLAGLAMVSRSAKNIIEIRKAIPRLELSVEVAA